MTGTDSNVRWFAELGLGDLEQVGGKNASLGEMVSHLTDLGVRVPDGFATTEERDTTMQYGVEEGAKNGFARVDALLARLAARVGTEAGRNG